MCVCVCAGHLDSQNGLLTLSAHGRDICLYACLLCSDFGEYLQLSLDLSTQNNYLNAAIALLFLVLGWFWRKREALSSGLSITFW